jgi:Mrp family chromosome partitioning ATPase
MSIDKGSGSEVIKNNEGPTQLERAYQIRQRLKRIKNKLVVLSGKGGVGKSTIAVNLAIALAMQNYSVGILDVDITGPNVPKMLGMEEMRPEVTPDQKGFYPILGPLNIKVMSMAFLLESPDAPVIWRGPMKMSAIRQFMGEGEWGDLDYLVIDLPPGTSDETLDILQLVEDAFMVIVTTPQDVALLDSRKTVMMGKMMKRKIAGIIENMAGLIVKCDHCGKDKLVDLFGSGGGEKAAMELGVPFLGRIPLELAVREQGDLGVPFISKYPESASAKAFQAVVTQIQKIISTELTNEKK